MQIIVLDATTKKLQIVLGEAATTQPVATGHYGDATATTFTEASVDAAANSTTPVDLVAAPGAATRRIVRELTIYNGDSISHTCRVILNNNGTSRIIANFTLAASTSWAMTQAPVGSVDADTLDGLHAAAFLLATGATTGATSQAQQFTSGIIAPSLKAVTDGIAAFLLKSASGADVLTVDTTNKRLGIGVAPGAYALNANGDIRAAGDVYVDGGMVDFGTDYIEEGATYLSLKGSKPLDVENLIIADGIAAPRSPVSLHDAFAIMRFDGPTPYSMDFTGNNRSHRGLAGVVSGGVTYRHGKFGKAVQIAGAATNLIPYPSFEIFTPGSPDNFSGWTETVGGGTIQAATLYAAVGQYCCRLTWPSGGAKTSIDISVTVTPSTTYTLSFNLILLSGTAYCLVNGNVSGTIIQPSYTTAINGRFAYTFTTGASDTTLLIQFARSGGTVDLYFDAVQLEQAAYASPYCDGSLGTGHAWTGTAHASTSSRTAAALTYTSGTLPVATGTLALWWQPAFASTVAPSYAYLFQHGNLKAYFDATDDKIYLTDGTNTISTAAQTFAANDWLHLAFAWSAAGLAIYVNGASAASGNSYTAPAATTLYVGSDSSSANQANGLLDELIIAEAVLTAYTLRAIYESNAPVAADSAVVPMPFYAPAALIGDATNGVNIASDGHLTLLGTARAWEDIRIEPTVRGTGSNNPSLTQWFTDGAGSRGVYLYLFDNVAANSQKEVFFTLQLPHAWAQTAIHIHVHWIASSTASSSKVRWGLEFTWAEPGQTFGNTTLVYADTVEGGATGTTQYQHEITEFAALTPSAAQDGFSSIMICRLWRDSANAADTYTGDVGLLYIDAHVEIDKFGSNSEYV